MRHHSHATCSQRLPVAIPTFSPKRLSGKPKGRRNFKSAASQGITEIRTIPTTSRRTSPRSAFRTTAWRSRPKSRSATTTRCRIPMKGDLAAASAGDGRSTAGSASISSAATASPASKSPRSGIFPTAAAARQTMCSIHDRRDERRVSKGAEHRPEHKGDEHADQETGRYQALRDHRSGPIPQSLVISRRRAAVIGADKKGR